MNPGRAENLGFGSMALIMGAINLINILLVFRVFRARTPGVATGAVQ